MADLSAVDREELAAKEFGHPQTVRMRDAQKESGKFPVRDGADAPGFTRYGAK